MKTKLITAIIFSPMIPALILAGGSGKPFSIYSDAMMFDYIVSMVGTIIIGVPSYFILNHYSKLNFLYFLLAGFLGGLLIIFIGMALNGFVRTPTLGGLLFFGVCGSLVSIGFWLFAIYIPSIFYSRNNEKKL